MDECAGKARAKVSGKCGGKMARSGQFQERANTYTYDYDSTRHRPMVGRPDENIVNVFTMDQIFAENIQP